jgi:hypothetical protein
VAGGLLGAALALGCPALLIALRDRHSRVRSTPPGDG